MMKEGKNNTIINETETRDYGSSTRFNSINRPVIAPETIETMATGNEVNEIITVEDIERLRASLNSMESQPRRTRTNSDDKLVTITNNTIRGHLYLVAIQIVALSFLLKFYLEMKDDLITRFASRMFLIFIATGFVHLIFYLMRVYQCIMHKGEIMTKRKYKSLVLFDNNKIKLIHVICEQVTQISVMIMVPIFVPFTHDNCHGYSEGLCFFGRYYGFFGVITMICYGIVVLALLIGLVFLCHIASQEGGFAIIKEQLQKIVRENQAAQLVLEQTPFQHLDMFNEECVICLEDGTEGNSDFIKLKCGHVLHSTCFTTFLQSDCQKVCPTCRQDLVGDISDFHQIVTNV